MKKHVMIIYILMILVGLIGVVYYLQHSQNQNQIEVASIKNTKLISVAVALHDLSSHSIIKADDFAIRSVTIPENDDSRFDIKNMNPVNAALRHKISANTYIPPSSLVEAGSDEYLSMFVQPGHVIYPFILDAGDEYLLKNNKESSDVDIYMSFSISTNMEGKHQIISPADNIKGSRLKPILYKKHILAVREQKIINDRSGNATEESRHVLLLDLADSELKVIKNLETKARLIVFPSTAEIMQDGKRSQHIDEVWPVTSENLFAEGPSVLSQDVNELRGNRE